MDEISRWNKWLDACTQISEETLPGVPVVEIAGTNRVLVERHQGVRGYSPECIEIGLSYGSLCVCGRNLCLSRMTRGQLVVTGEVQNLQIRRRHRS